MEWEQDGQWEREMGQEIGSITIAQEMVKNELGRGSIYTWEEKTTPLGWVTSVTHQGKVTFRVLVS